MNLLLLLLFSYILMAGSFILSKSVLVYSAPIFYVGFRMVLAGAILIGYCYWKDSAFLRIKRKDYRHFAMIVLMHIYLSLVLFVVALQDMSSSKAAFICYLSPFITVLFSYIYFHETMTPKKWVGLLIGFSGFLPELMAEAPGEQNGHLFFLSWSELMMIGSVVATVIGWISMRSLVKGGYRPVVINGIGMLGGGLLALVTSLLFEPGWHPVPVTDWWPFLKIIAAMIVTTNLTYYNLYGYLLNIYTASFMAFFSFLSPLFAALLGWYFLGETISPTFFFSLFVMVIGLAIFYQEELRQGYIKANS